MNRVTFTSCLSTIMTLITKRVTKSIFLSFPYTFYHGSPRHLYPPVLVLTGIDKLSGSQTEDGRGISFFSLYVPLLVYVTRTCVLRTCFRSESVTFLENRDGRLRRVVLGVEVSVGSCRPEKTTQKLI